MLRSIFVASLATIALVAANANDNSAAASASTKNNKKEKGKQQCERLPTSLIYSQIDAPTDISGILRVVVEKINRDVTGVLDVEVGWTGAELHRKVGERIVTCTVTRLAESYNMKSSSSTATTDDDNNNKDLSGGGEQQTTHDEYEQQNVITQCFEVPFTILDVDECDLPPSHPMVHQCIFPAVCINTLGSYECACPSKALDSSFFYNEPKSDKKNDGGTVAAVVTKTFWDDLHSDIEAEMNQFRTAGTIPSLDNNDNDDDVDEPIPIVMPKTPHLPKWDVSLNSSSASTCPGLPSTHGCCDDDAHIKEGRDCRLLFQCPIDPCSSSSSSNRNSNNETKSSSSSVACASNALCEHSSSPLSRPNFICHCPPGQMGNGRPCTGYNGRNTGREPKVKYDGITPTEETARALEMGTICGCSEPTVDVCDGFPKCAGKHEICAIDTTTSSPHCTCMDGFIHEINYGCVDENPPLLNLRPDPVHGTDLRTGITHLIQGARYEEYGVDVIDDNAEEYLRRLKITYSRPLPQGCLLDMGTFTVNYTVATPWTTPNFVRATRTVVIDNVDECQLSGETHNNNNGCPELVAMCDYDAGAVCKDEDGTYSCTCPRGTKGDGFRPISRLKSNGKGGFTGILVPTGYIGGIGCNDVVAPVIELLGPNPKRFRVARASGIKGVINLHGDNNDGSNAKIEALIVEQRKMYENDIKTVIEATHGAELCATKSNPNVRPADCVHAKDHTHKGIVDLTSRVIVGDPLPKHGVGSGSHQWRVPYNVVDDAGNKAKTVWRDIIVEEVDIEDFEQKSMDERSVNVASTNEMRRNELPPQCVCPPCDPCNCNSNGSDDILTPSACTAICNEKVAVAQKARILMNTCTSNKNRANENRAPDHEIIQHFLLFLEGLMGRSSMMLVLLGCFTATVAYVLQRVISALFISSGPQTRTYYHTNEDNEREREMMRNVSYFRSPTPSTSQSPGSGSASGPRPPPTGSLSFQTNGIFNVQESSSTNRTLLQEQGRTSSSPFHSNSGVDNIYQSASPITPLRHGHPSPGSQGAKSPYGS